MLNHARITRLLLLPLLVQLAACSADDPRPTPISLESTRGIVLISLDTLGAAHLGTYSDSHDTSPFFDRLASRGVLFENALAQYPSTLVSHVSLFTGLYPREHGVFGSSSVLSTDIATLPQRLQHHGFRTAGHTEGGYVSRDFDLDRGFDEFYGPSHSSTTDVESTFERGLTFLRSLTEDEPFFLFLHTYAVHNPYDPPEPFLSRYLPDDLEQPPVSAGGYLRDINMRRHDVTPEDVSAYHGLYDGGVLYLDSILEQFFGELEALGLTRDTTIIVTSDHGEEFFEHGRLSHSQVYPETMHVPLLVLHPSLPGGRRVPDLVRLIDLAPTLYEMFEIPAPDPISGRSLVPLLTSRQLLPAEPAFAEMLDLEKQQTVFVQEDDALLQYVVAERLSEPDGTWVAEEATLDTKVTRLDVELVSFHVPREVAITVNGEDRETVVIGTRWTPVSLELGEPRSHHRVRFATDGCDVPMWLGLGSDTRCLSFKVKGAPLRRAELFDLSADRTASRDISRDRQELAEELAKSLALKRWNLVAEPDSRSPSADTQKALKALGYLQ